MVSHLATFKSLLLDRLNDWLFQFCRIVGVCIQYFWLRVRNFKRRSESFFRLLHFLLALLLFHLGNLLLHFECLSFPSLYFCDLPPLFFDHSIVDCFRGIETWRVQGFEIDVVGVGIFFWFYVQAEGAPAIDVLLGAEKHVEACVAGDVLGIYGVS